MRSALRSGFLGFLLLAAAGCGDDTANGAADSGVPLDLAPAPDLNAVTTVQTTINGFPGDFDGGFTPLVGVTVCARHDGSSAPPTCAETGNTGVYFLPWIFENGVDIWTFEADGYLGVTSVMWSTGSDGSYLIGPTLLTDAYAAEYLGPAFTYPPNGTGFARLRLQSTANIAQGIGGATVSLAGAKIVYTDADGKPDPSATATSSKGEVLLGNLPADAPFVIDIAAPGLTCNPTPDRQPPSQSRTGVVAQPRYGTAGPGDNSVKGWAAAHTLVDLIVNCK